MFFWSVSNLSRWSSTHNELEISHSISLLEKECLKLIREFESIAASYPNSFLKDLFIGFTELHSLPSTHDKSLTHLSLPKPSFTIQDLLPSIVSSLLVISISQKKSYIIYNN